MISRIRRIYHGTSNFQKIVFFTGVGILVLGCIAVVLFMELLSKMPEEVEIINIDGISYFLEKQKETDELASQISKVHSLLREKVGPPCFEGKVVLTFDPGLEGNGEVNRVSASKRLIKFSASMNVVGTQRHILIDEIVHAAWQSDAVLKHYPVLAIEGVAWSLAEQLSKEKESRLIPELSKYYFRKLPGLLDPDVDIHKYKKWRKLLYYEVSSMLFLELDQIDPTLMPKLLRDKPTRRLNWLSFCKRMVQKSDLPHKVRDILNNCRIFFSPLPEDYFVIPMRKYADSEVMSFGIFSPDLQKHVPLKLDYSIKYGSGSYSDKKVVFLDGGYGELELQIPKNIKAIDVAISHLGKPHQVHIPFEGGERR